MNIPTGKDLARSCREVRGNTITIAEEISDGQYGFQAAPEVRSVQRMIGLVPHLTRRQQERFAQPRQ